MTAGGYWQRLTALADHPRRREPGWVALVGAPILATDFGLRALDVIADLIDHEAGDPDE